jgi:hypothetical protein
MSGLKSSTSTWCFVVLSVYHLLSLYADITNCLHREVGMYPCLRYMATQLFRADPTNSCEQAEAHAGHRHAGTYGPVLCSC